MSTINKLIGLVALSQAVAPRVAGATSSSSNNVPVSPAGGVVVRALDLRLKRSRVRISAVPLSVNNLGQVVHTHVPLSPTRMPCGWGGNRIGLASHWPCVTDFSDTIRYEMLF